LTEWFFREFSWGHIALYHTKMYPEKVDWSPGAQVYMKVPWVIVTQKEGTTNT
jgi:hypothetical protein